MDILVTGSNGFIGHYLKIALAENNHKVISFDISDGKDICQKKHFDNLKTQIDVVIHLASNTFVPDSYKKPYDFFNVNTQGTLNVLEYCRNSGARMVYISSYVYGVPQTTPITENHPTFAFNPYAASKLIAEDLCKHYHQFWNVPITVLRPFNIYGYGQGNSFLLPQIVEQAFEGHIQILDPRPKRDFVHVGDVVLAIVKSAERQEQDLNILNVGTGVSHSVQEAVDLISTHFDGVKVTASNVERKNEVADTIADVSKIKEVLAWEPIYSFKDGLSQMIGAYKQKYSDNGK